MITSSANRQFTVIRRTSFLMDAVTADSSLSFDRSIQSSTLGSFVQVTVADGTTGSGEVTVSGTDTDGGSATDTLTFGGNGTKVTATKWASVSGMTTSGLADEASVPTVSARAVSADGTYNLIQYTVASARPALLVEKTVPNYPAFTAGTKAVDKSVVRFDYEDIWAPKVDDLLQDDGTSDQWIALGVRLVGFGVSRRHWYVETNRYQT